MIFRILVLFLVMLTQITAQKAFCNFAVRNFDGDRLYSCALSIENPLELEITEIEGEHQDEMTDDDVLAVSQAFGSTVEVLPSIVCGRFRNVENIYLDESGMKAINNGSFGACLELKWLSLYGNNLTFISDDAFKNNLKLQYLDIGDSFIDSLPNGIFENLINLEYLDIRNNQIVNLPSFSSLEKLQTLLLDNTGLTEIDNYLFDGLSNLTTLYLNDNKITEISKPVFTNLNSLQILFLNNNGLKKFSSDAFSGLSNLLLLYLQFNNITEIENFSFIDCQNLILLDFFVNEIENIEPNAFNGLSNLLTLNLERSKIKNLHSPTFSDLKNLNNLVLNVNEIEELPEGIFNYLTKIFFIGLWGNKLRVINRNIFGENVGTLTTLDLNENDIIGFDRKLFNDARDLDYLYFFENRCFNNWMPNIRENREKHEKSLERCFSNFELIVDITTNENEDFSFHSAIQPGIDIEIKTRGVISIILSSSPSLTQPTLEILFGTDNNTRTIIKKDQTTVAVTVSTPNIINFDEKSVFRVTWANHVVLVFQDGLQWPFMAFSMNKVFDVNYFGLKTLESFGKWYIEPIWS